MAWGTRVGGEPAKTQGERRLSPFPRARKPDVVAETDVGTKNTGIEVKTSDAPATVRKANDQLANEASFEGKGFFDEKPWTIGIGSGVVYTPHGLLHILPANLSKN